MHRLLTIVALILAALAPAAAPAAPAPAVDIAGPGLALRGYDPVAYFTSGMPTKGSADYQLEWNGAKWRFASAASRDAFRAAPERYAPQFGGYCAWAVSQGYIAPGDPLQWKIVGDRLYLNFNARAKALWEADQAAAIARGQANWPTVLTSNQDSGR